MKKVSLAVAASFSLFSFSAFAGGLCNYGHDKHLAASVEDTVIHEQVDPNLLALLKKQDDSTTEKMSPITTFN